MRGFLRLFAVLLPPLTGLATGAAAAPCDRPSFDLPYAGHAPSSVEELQDQRTQIDLFRACLLARQEAAGALAPQSAGEIARQIEAVELVSYTLQLFIVALQGPSGS